jgi:hypothetical protein
MSLFFQQFPTMMYDAYGTGKPIEVVDIFRAVRIKKNIRDDVLLYTYYNVQDGERPDHVSMNLYGTTDYYWTFFMVNENLVNVFTDWPLSRAELEHKIDMKYQGDVMSTDTDISNKFIQGEVLQGLQSGATTTILEKDTNLGLVKIDGINHQFKSGELIRGLTSNDTMILSDVIPFKDAVHHYIDADGNVAMRALNVTPVTNSEYEHIDNESKTRIRVIRPEYIARLAEEFFKQINPEAQ